MPNTQSTWKGVPLSDMTKDELIEALELMGKMYKEQSDKIAEQFNTLSRFRSARRV